VAISFDPDTVTAVLLPVEGWSEIVPGSLVIDEIEEVSGKPIDGFEFTDQASARVVGRVEDLLAVRFGPDGG